MTLIKYFIFLNKTMWMFANTIYHWLSSKRNCINFIVNGPYWVPNWYCQQQKRVCRDKYSECKAFQISNLNWTAWVQQTRAASCKNKYFDENSNLKLNCLVFRSLSAFSVSLKIQIIAPSCFLLTTSSINFFFSHLLLRVCFWKVYYLCENIFFVGIRILSKVKRKDIWIIDTNRKLFSSSANGALIHRYTCCLPMLLIFDGWKVYFLLTVCEHRFYHLRSEVREIFRNFLFCLNFDWEKVN